MRYCTTQDLPTLAALEAACFPADAWSESALASHLNSAQGYAILAERDGRAVGFLTGSLIPPEGELYRIATLPAHRGKGIGEELIAHFLADLSKRGCNSIFLEVRESNTAARALYEKHGMQVVARRKQYYEAPKEDAILYALTPNNH